jgi:hypothetical protein
MSVASGNSSFRKTSIAPGFNKGRPLVEIITGSMTTFFAFARLKNRATTRTISGV